jgi:phosphate/sulfate permease
MLESVIGAIAGISTAMAVGGCFMFMVLRATRRDESKVGEITALVMLIGLAGMVLSALALNILILFRK